VQSSARKGFRFDPSGYRTRLAHTSARRLQNDAPELTVHLPASLTATRTCARAGAPSEETLGRLQAAVDAASARPTRPALDAGLVVACGGEQACIIACKAFRGSAVDCVVSSMFTQARTCTVSNLKSSS
jgi:hypothetical protein